MLHTGGGVGDCLCAYVVATRGFNITQDAISSNITIDTNVIASSAVLTGNITSVEYSITRYQGGLQVGLDSGTLLMGNSATVNYPFADQTFLLVYRVFTDDGAVFSSSTIEVSSIGGGLAGGITQKAQVFTVDGCSLITAKTKWSSRYNPLDTAAYYAMVGTLLEEGAQYNGDIPADGGLAFLVTFDKSFYPDLPLEIPNMVGWSMNGVMCNA